MACAVVGWYGPLIDLAKASSHLDDFVQLIVFVRSTQPIQMYVWDQGGQIPLVVKNKAAQILFGNISAENVYKCYKNEGRKSEPNHVGKVDLSHPGSCRHSKAPRSSNPTGNKQGPEAAEVECNGCRTKPNIYRIWLILVKVLLQLDENSPFRFEIMVDWEKDVENGRFELLSFKMPCSDIGGS